MERLRIFAGRDAVAGLATAGSMVAAVAAAGLLVASGLSLERWPGAGQPERGAALQVGPGAGGAIAAVSRGRAPLPASASGAPTPASGLPRRRASGGAHGATRVPTGPAGEMSGRRLAAHVPDAWEAGRAGSPAPRADGLARVAAGLEASGDAAGARLAGAGRRLGTALGAVSPTFDRTVAWAGDRAGAATGRGVRGAAAIIRRLRPRP